MGRVRGESLEKQTFILSLVTSPFQGDREKGGNSNEEPQHASPANHLHRRIHHKPRRRTHPPLSPLFHAISRIPRSLPKYSTLYQTGVFVSRSSTPFICIHSLYIPSFLQVLNLAVLLTHAKYNYLQTYTSSLPSSSGRAPSAAWSTSARSPRSPRSRRVTRGSSRWAPSPSAIREGYASRAYSASD